MAAGSGLLFVLAGSAAAVAGLVGLNAMVGGWTPARVDSLDEAVERLAKDLVGFEPGEGVLAADGRAALVLDRDAPRLGLVIARRDRLVCRGLKAGDIASVAADARDSTSIDLRLTDYTLPQVRVRLSDSAEAEAWLTRLRPFARTA